MIKWLKKVLKCFLPPPTNTFYQAINRLLAALGRIERAEKDNADKIAGLNRKIDALTARVNIVSEQLAAAESRLASTESAVIRQINAPFSPCVASPLPVLDDKQIDICGAMPDDESQKSWGDLHFAVALKKEFERSGFKANIIFADQWYASSPARYTLVLRGNKPYFPYAVPGKKFILWNISHPNDVPIEEYNLYDYVLFASERLYQKLNDRIRPASDYLLQCTDPEVMLAQDTQEKRFELLFVGNSRSVYRKILADLLPTTHALTVYGDGWDRFAPVKPYVVEKYLDNTKVGQAYHDAKILLNDHWDDMRENGIVSNRIFDALAAGAFVISDYMPEIDELFDGAVIMYETKEELREKIDFYLAHADLRKELAEKGKRIVLDRHTFRHRVNKILSVIKSL